MEKGADFREAGWTLPQKTGSTGTPIETIINQQTASSGMYAFGEGLVALYLVTLIYLRWPILFNLACRLFKRQSRQGL